MRKLINKIKCIIYGHKWVEQSTRKTGAANGAMRKCTRCGSMQVTRMYKWMDFPLLIVIIPLILLSCGKGKPQVQAKQLAQQKTIDTADLTMKLSLRRIGTMLNTQELDIAYYRAANLYYQTHKEKYRVQANMLHEQYEKSFALYAAQDDSLNNFLGIVDTVSFLASNGQIPANNLEGER